MTSVAPFAYEPDGRVYVCADGPELYAYSGANDAPLWKQFCDGILVGVAASGDKVYSLDTDGRLHGWRTIDGEKMSEVLLDMPAHGLAVSRAGTALVLVDEGVVYVTERGDFQKLEVPGATTMTFNRDGSRVAIGTKSGKLALYEVQTTGEMANIDLGGPIAALDWSPKRQWLAVVGSTIHMVAEDILLPAPEGQEPPSPIESTMELGSPPRFLSVSFDGVLLACDDGENRVDIYELFESKRGGTIQYERPLGGVAFGPDTMLGIGLEYADANRVDAVTGKLTRSLPGLGRGGETWFQRVEVDAVMLRGAVAAARAGGKPIAEIVYEEESGGKGCWIAAAASTFFLFSCIGCSGLAAIIFYLKPW